MTLSDLSSFQSNSSVLEWINNNLNAEQDASSSDLALHDPLSRIVANLQKQLQSLEQSVNLAIKSQTNTIIQGVTKASFELDNAKKGTEALQPLINYNSINIPEQDDLFRDLKRLNLVKVNMESTRKALKSSEKWYLLSSDMDSMISKGDLEGGAQRLHEARLSLNMLPKQSRAQKEKLLHEYQNKIEGLLSMSIVQVIQSGDKDKLTLCFQQFCKIDRESEFSSFYQKINAASLCKLLEDLNPMYAVGILDLSQTLEHTLKNLTNQLTSLHRLTLDIFNVSDTEERSDARSSFEPSHLTSHVAPHVSSYVSNLTPSSVASVIMTDIMRVVIVDLTNKVFSRLNSADPEIPAAVTRLYEVTLKFVCDVEALLLNSRLDPLLLLSPDAWSASLFTKFLSFQIVFDSNLLQKSTSFIEKSFRFPSNQPINEVIPLFEERISLLFGQADSLWELNSKFCLGFHLNACIKAVDLMTNECIQCLVEVAERFKTLVSPSSDSSSVWSTFQHGLGILALGMLLQQETKNWLHSVDWITLRNLLEKFTIATSTDRTLIVDAFTSIFHSSSATSTSNSKTSNSKTSHIKTSGGTSTMGGSANNLNRSNVTCTSFTAAYIIANSKLNNSNLKSTKALPSIDGLVGTRLSTSLGMIQSCVFSILYCNLGQSLQSLDYSIRESKNSSPFNLEIPKFSLSPSPNISKMGDYLLTLPQNLDMFSEHPALTYSPSTLPCWTISEYNCLVERFTSEYEQEMDAQYTWLVALCLCCMKDLLNKLLNQKSVTLLGLKQMITDISYIINVISALDLDPLDRLIEFLSYLEMETDELKSKQKLDSNDLLAKVCDWKSISHN